MKWWESIIHIIGITFCHYVYIKSYSLIFKNEIQKITIKTGIILLIITILTYYNTFYNYGFSKIIISFLEFLIILKEIYQENIKNAVIKTIILYLIGWLVEMLMGITMAYFFINGVQQFDKNIIFKALFSNMMMLVILILSYTSFVKKICKKLYDSMVKIFNMTLLTIILIMILVLLTYYLIVSTDIYSIGSILLLIITLFSLIIISMIQSIKTKMATDKQEILLNFMKEYEMIIDKERIDRHEMVNNLLVLKSIKNKNTKQYNKVLDDILLTYQSNRTPKGLYELPSGLKGLFYYKIYDMKNKNIEVFINVSNKIIKDLDGLDSKLLTKVCKILGILLDNAKEAACESKNKLVVIDLYKEENDIIIYIENSINEDNSVDIKKLKVKGFSTKGNNRGYGLYIVNKLLGDTNKIVLDQYIKDNKFISIMAIKNN